MTAKTRAKKTSTGTNFKSKPSLDECAKIGRVTSCLEIRQLLSVFRTCVANNTHRAVFFLCASLVAHLLHVSHRGGLNSVSARENQFLAFIRSAATCFFRLFLESGGLWVFLCQSLLILEGNALEIEAFHGIHFRTQRLKSLKGEYLPFCLALPPFCP